MSLVNDALKRTKEAHDRQAGAPLRGAPLHAAAAPPASKMWVIALLAFVLALAAAGGGIWYWQKHQSLPFFKTHTKEAPKPAYTIIIGANPDAKHTPAPAPPSRQSPSKPPQLNRPRPRPKSKPSPHPRHPHRPHRRPPCPSRSSCKASSTPPPNPPPS